MQSGLRIVCGVTSGAVPNANEQASTVEEDYDLLGLERPVQLGAIVAAVQYRDPQAVTPDPGFVVGNVHQFDQQVMLDEGHQYCLRDFAEVATGGSEELAFRRY